MLDRRAAFFRVFPIESPTLWKDFGIIDVAPGNLRLRHFDIFRVNLTVETIL
jgi:hypothetical protein